MWDRWWLDGWLFLWPLEQRWLSWRAWPSSGMTFTLAPVRLTPLQVVAL